MATGFNRMNKNDIETHKKYHTVNMSIYVVSGREQFRNQKFISDHLHQVDSVLYQTVTIVFNYFYSQSIFSILFLL